MIEIEGESVLDALPAKQRDRIRELVNIAENMDMTVFEMFMAALATVESEAESLPDGPEANAHFGRLYAVYKGVIDLTTKFLKAPQGANVNTDIN
jgi:hypothetical protein